MPVCRLPRLQQNAGRWIGLLAIGYAVAAHAGPPFVTDDPEPVEYQHWEVNYGATFEHASGASSGALPGIDINYGIAPGVQLHAQPQAAYGSGSGSRAYGIGDTELGVKYRLTSESGNPRDWMVGIYPMLELPTGNAARGLGAGAHSLYLPVWFQTTRGRWTNFGGGGYRLNYGAGSRNAWAGGWAVLYQVHQDLQLGGELFAATPNASNAGSASGFNLGGVYQLGEHASLLFSAGRGLTNAAATNQGSAYLGLRVTY